MITLAEDILLHVRVGREVDGGEGDITQQTCRGAFVQSEQAQLAHNVNGATWDGSLHLGSFTLYLQANFASSQRISKGLHAEKIYEKAYTISSGFVKTCLHDSASACVGPMGNSTHHLTTSGRTTSDQLPHELDAPGLWVCRAAPHEVVYSKPDGFLWGNTLKQVR